MNRLFYNTTCVNLKLSRVSLPKNRDQNNRDFPVIMANPIHTCG